MLKWVSMGIIHSRYSSERLRISSVTKVESRYTTGSLTENSQVV